uniref:t-SNARE coiled-coil homology domain-containing protein n=1 Tax=Cryptomonas curvata TaxID=233186 RepID=A0A7S0QKP1_9CRYP
MSDEMEGLDDEVRSLCLDIRKDLTALEQITESMSSDQINKALHAIKGKVERAKSVFQKCKLELRDLRGEQFAVYERKIKEHARSIDELSRQVNSEKERISSLKQKKSVRTELFGTMDLEKGKDASNGETKTAQQLIIDAKVVQSQSMAAVIRMNHLVGESEEIGVRTNAQLSVQTQQMGAIKTDIDKVQANMSRADKLLSQIGRSLMTDKMILCLVLLVVIGIIVIVVLKVMGVDLKVSGGGGGGGLLVIDCNLEWMRNSKECQEALNGRN